MNRGAGVLAVGAVLAVALLAVDVFLTFVNTRQLRHDDAWVTHSHEVITGLERILSMTKDAESGQRGYLVTGNPLYLEPYHAAIESLHARLDEVEALVSDSPSQLGRLARLRGAIEDRLVTLERNVELQRDSRFEEARQSVGSGIGWKQMEAARAVSAEMLLHEQGLLADRSRESERSYQVAVGTGLVSGLSAMAAIVGFLLLLRRHLARRTLDARVISEQAERLRTTLASIGDAVISTDADGRVTSLNPAAEAITGWTAAEAVGRDLDEVFHILNEDTRQRAPNPARRALAEGLIVGLANHTMLIARDGSEHPIDDSAAPIRCREGEVVGCVLVFRDVTERRRDERALLRTTEDLRRISAELSEAARRKDEFLATLAHELRNPLAPIRSGLEVLRLAGSREEVAVRTRSMIERQLAQLVRLVDDLLDVSRISRGKLELQLERVDLAAALEAAIETSRPSLEAGGHRLGIELPREAVAIDGDPTRLSQVFANLLQNAAKFSEPGGPVRLRAEREGGEVAVTVTDEGIGISAEMLPRVFEMFAQGDRSLERAAGGLGIGLTLVKTLTELHGGRVEARSAGPGQGSAFIVHLPVAPPLGAQVAEPAVEPRELRPPADRRRVLVADDNVDAATSLSTLLELAGHEVRTVHDGGHALVEARAFRPEVLLLDIGMPGFNGYEVCRRIRSERGAGPLIVALTGWGQEQDKQRSRDAGFDHHLVKPVEPAALDRLLRDGVDGRAGQAGQT